MQLTFASYNIHKAIGLDRRRDPDRIIAILREIDADVIALQEADRRFGRRETVLPRAALDDSPWRTVPLRTRPDSIGWHGNALLVRRSIDIVHAMPVPLPTLEPRGAIYAELRAGGQLLRVVGMHLDLSGLRRRHQLRAILDHLATCPGAEPTVLMGDMNDWSSRGGALREFGHGWEVHAPGRSFPSRRPIAQLDRIVTSRQWTCTDRGVHHSTLAARASDHLPVWAKLEIGA